MTFYLALRYINRPENKHDFSSIAFLSPCNSIGGDIVMRPFLCGWASGCVRGSVALNLVGTIQTTVFSRSLSNFTCKFFMMRQGILLIFGHSVKGQGQIWHFETPCGHDTGYSFCPITFKLHMQIIHDARRNPFDFGSRVKVKVKFSSLSLNPCGQYRLPFLSNHFQTSGTSCE